MICIHRYVCLFLACIDIPRPYQSRSVSLFRSYVSGTISLMRVTQTRYKVHEEGDRQEETQHSTKTCLAIEIATSDILLCTSNYLENRNAPLMSGHDLPRMFFIRESMCSNFNSHFSCASRTRRRNSNFSLCHKIDRIKCARIFFAVCLTKNKKKTQRNVDTFFL